MHKPCVLQENYEIQKAEKFVQDHTKINDFPQLKHRNIKQITKLQQLYPYNHLSLGTLVMFD